MSYTQVIKNDIPVVLGKGTFGKVYLVEDESGNKFAYKECNYYKYLNLTLYEAEVMKELLGCPQIVQLVDSVPVQYGKGCNLVLELCDGTLLDLLADSDGKGLSESVVLDMIRDVSTGLAFMRSKCISHCDLKMENILYKMDECSKSGYRFLIGDFGNAEFGDTMKSFHRIQSHHYRSGENLMKSLNISSCDMASLACIIYESITDRYLVNNSDQEEEAQLETHLNAIGFDLIFKSDINLMHPVNDLAVHMYFEGIIEKKGFIEYPESHFQRHLVSLGYTHKDEITNLIQRMLLPVPEKRIQAEEVKDLPFITEDEEEFDNNYGLNALIKALYAPIPFDLNHALQWCQLIDV
jgi:serine/threonine protein kinase